MPGRLRSSFAKSKTAKGSSAKGKSTSKIQKEVKLKRSNKGVFGVSGS